MYSTRRKPCLKATLFAAAFVGIYRRAALRTLMRSDDTATMSCFRAGAARRNGPPSRAVIMPTGDSVGAISIRAAVSQMTKNAPPKSQVAGTGGSNRGR